MYSRILATGSYLPQQIRTNADLEKMVDTSDEWISVRTGIKERRIAAANETVATMGYEAAKQCLAIANIDANEIDLVLVATTSGSHAFPSAACQIQQMLNIEDAISFDLAAACSGFVYALSVADQFIRTGKVKKALVIGSDLLSRRLNEQDRGTVILFGDGAGAVILEAAEQPGIISTHLHASGKDAGVLSLPINLPAQQDPDGQIFRSDVLPRTRRSSETYCSPGVQSRYSGYQTTAGYHPGVLPPCSCRSRSARRFPYLRHKALPRCSDPPPASLWQ